MNRNRPGDEPLLSVRSALILLSGLVGAGTGGALTILAGAPWAQAVLTGAGAFVAVVVFLDSIIA